MVHSLSKTVLMFSNDWSNHCKELHKVTLCTDLGDIDYHEVNVLKDSDLTKQWGIRSVPTLILLDEDAKELKRHTGSLSTVALMQFLGEHPVTEPWKETW